MSRITVRRHGAQYGVYHNGVFQCYWLPHTGSSRLYLITRTLIEQLGPATLLWT